MFFRQKKSGNRVYLQIVENRWEDGRSKQRVIATLGRLDQLRQTGQLEGLLRSGAKFCESILLLAAHRRGETTAMRTRPIGPAMIFERLWKETGCQEVISRLLQGRKFEIDEKKIERESRYDGKWVLRTNTDLSAADVALKYKQLWMVEYVFRSTKSLLETRPIWHNRDETIRGHVFCSFLALVLRKELDDRLAAQGHKLEWEDVIRELLNLQCAEVQQDGKRFLLRSEAQGTCGKVFAASGVALPPTVQQIEAP